MSVPIFMYHQGAYCPFLNLSAKQARARNPKSKIVVLLKPHNSLDFLKYEKETEGFKINFEDAKSYFRGARAFEEVYEHMSTNPESFELPCFLRWFVVREYCMSRSIKQYFYLDNDVLLYCSLADVLEEHFRDFAYTMTNNVSWGISFMNDVKWLNKFCDFMMDVYGMSSENGKFYYSKLLSHYNDLQTAGKQGGICDMSLIEHFRKDAFTPPGLVGEMSAIVREELTDVESCFYSYVFYTFDHNINQSDSFRMKNGIKDIEMVTRGKKKMPVCYNEFLEQDVFFNCLHFQGQAKSLMGHFVDKEVLGK